MKINVSKNIANAFGYTEPLQETKQEVKLFTDSSEKRCKMCGNIHNEGYIDKKNMLFGAGNNSFYSFADVTSDFLCSYCYYNSSLYKKNSQRNRLDAIVVSKIELKSRNELEKAIESLRNDFVELEDRVNNKEIKLEASQMKKMRNIAELSKVVNAENTQKILSLIFDYKILSSFVENLGEAELAKRYEKMNDIADIIVFDNHFESKNFKSTSTENDLYEIFKNPPAPPFVILLKKQKGTTFEFNAHCSKPTIDKELIVVNYGIETFYVSRKKVFECLDNAEKIYARHRKKKTKNHGVLNISDDVLFNRATSLSYDSYFHYKIRSNELFMNDYTTFINKYDKGTRVVAKILLNTYRKQHKE